MEIKNSSHLCLFMRIKTSQHMGIWCFSKSLVLRNIFTNLELIWKHLISMLKFPQITLDEFDA